MLFKKEHIIPIVMGQKISTRRKSKRVKVGNEYKCQERPFTSEYFARIQVENVYKQPLGEMTEDDFIREGYQTKAQFVEVWERINGEGSWDETKQVWVIDFVVIEIPVQYESILEIVPHGTEEPLWDIEHLLAKYPALDPIINPPTNQPTKQERYEAVINPKVKESDLDKILEVELEAASLAPKPTQPAPKSQPATTVTPKYHAPAFDIPKLTDQDLQRIDWIEMDEAQLRIKELQVHLQGLQDLKNDADKEIFSTQKEIAKYQTFVSKKSIKMRTRIKRSYEHESGIHY